MRIGLFTGLIAVIALATAAGAAPSLEFSIGLCAGKTNAKARLACYDAIAAQLREGQVPAAAPAPIPTPAPVPAAAVPAPMAAAPQPAPVAAAPAPAPAPVAAAPIAAAPVAAAPPPPAAQPESLFGSEQIAKQARQAAGAPAEADAISSTLKSFSFTPLGRVIVTLDNGQVWRQIDGDTEQFRGKAGDTITIERAILGSYNLTVSSHTGLFKVHRVH